MFIYGRLRQVSKRRFSNAWAAFGRKSGREGDEERQFSYLPMKLKRQHSVIAEIFKAKHPGKVL